MKFDKVYQYNFPTTIRFGPGAVKELSGYLKKNNLNSPLIVTDPNIAQLSFFRHVLQDLEQNQFSVEVFSGIHKNPLKSDVYRGVDVWDLTLRDVVIGIGGGAALDVARAMVLRVYHREDLFIYDDLIGGDVLVTNDVPPFIAIPTTAGTGSEVGRSAIIADDETHRKRILFSPKLIANIVFADPELTMELPAAITAATGMDALTHNLEAYLAWMPHPVCEGIALEGISLISKNIEAATHKPNLENRSNMLIASIMGAIAFQKGLGVVHSLAHPLSSLLDTHHGLANAVNLPYGMKFNIEGSEEKFRRIARTLELKNENGEAVVSYLEDLNAKINIPRQLRGIGVEEGHIETLADLAFADFAHPNNPRPVSRADFKQLYQQAL